MPGIRDLWRDAARELLVHSLFLMPEARRVQLDRRLRGQEEARKLAAADAAILSYGKSGRTWLRVMLSRLCQQAFGLPEGQMLEFDNLHRLDARAPKLLFSHGNYIRDHAGEWNTRRHLWSGPTILLVRDPRDVAVSQYHQWRHRMRRWKKVINRYPRGAADLPLVDFVLDPEVGLPAIVAWLCVFEQELDRFRAIELVRYEDLRQDTAGELRRMLPFLGLPTDPALVADAVDYARLDNMRRLETTGGLKFAGIRGRPGDERNPASFKTRKGKVGGWRDELAPDEQARVRAALEPLAPLPFGYALD